jgi:Carboxypeptidase regulatory-like domain
MQLGIKAYVLIFVLSVPALSQTGALKARIVEYATNVAIAGAHISFKDFKTHQRFKITTDSQGNFELLAPVGVYRMTVTAKGFAKMADTVEVEKAQAVPFSWSLYSKKTLKAARKSPIVILHALGTRFF